MANPNLKQCYQIAKMAVRDDLVATFATSLSELAREAQSELQRDLVSKGRQIVSLCNAYQGILGQSKKVVFYRFFNN